MRNKKGFTLAELMVVVAIIGVLVAVSVPIFNSQLEKSREATDLANVRSAYAQVMTEAMSKDGLPEPVAVFLNQTQDGWQTKLPITIGGVTFNDTESDNWKGTPKGKGMCRVSYEKDRGVIFNWEGGYAGDASASINKYMNYDTLSGTGNMNTEQAYYSGLELRFRRLGYQHDGKRDLYLYGRRTGISYGKCHKRSPRRSSCSVFSLCRPV